jgi:hypothetical protein
MTTGVVKNVPLTEILMSTNIRDFIEWFCEKYELHIDLSKYKFVDDGTFPLNFYRFISIFNAFFEEVEILPPDLKQTRKEEIYIKKGVYRPPRLRKRGDIEQMKEVIVTMPAQYIILNGRHRVAFNIIMEHAEIYANIQA